MEFWCGRVFRSSFPQTKTLALSGGGSELRMIVQKIRTIIKELLKETMLLAHSHSFTISSLIFFIKRVEYETLDSQHEISFEKTHLAKKPDPSSVVSTCAAISHLPGDEIRRFHRETDLES